MTTTLNPATESAMRASIHECMERGDDLARIAYIKAFDLKSANLPDHAKLTILGLKRRFMLMGDAEPLCMNTRLMVDNLKAYFQ